MHRTYPQKTTTPAAVVEIDRDEKVNVARHLVVAP
jgi:hypothetical protein